MDRLEELAIFVTILEAGSLAGAARRLNRSPPAVTRHLAALEDRLGVRLVERTTRRLAPTAAGRQLADQARRILADYGEAMRTTEAGQPLRGIVRLTAPVVFGRLHVMPLVNRFLNAFPEISIEVRFADGILDLIEQELDLAVRIGELADSSLVARRVGTVRRMLVANPAYLAARGTPAAIGDLARHDLIGNPVSTDWGLMENGRRRTVAVMPRLMVNQVEAALAAARDGLGIARALSYQVVGDLAAGTLVAVLTTAEPAPLPVQIVVPGTRLLPARTRAFLDHLAQGLRGLAVISGG